MSKKIGFFIGFIALFVLAFFVSCQNPFFQKLSGIYDVNFSTNGGTEVSSMHTRKINESPVTTKTDCDFDGWYTTSDFTSEKISFPFELTDNITLYAKWNQKYRVNFQTFDGSAVETQLVSILVEVETPYKTNCDFAGWYTNSNFTGEPIVLPYTVTKPTTLYAKYLQRYTLKFETNGGNAIDDMTIALIQVLPEPVRTNFDFDGWYLYPNFSGTPLQLPYTITHNMTLYAKWLPTYLVSFETNGGTAINSYRARNLTSLQTPTKAGFTFLGWYLDSGFSDVAEFPMALEADTTFYAKWQQNHTVTFNSQGGSSVASITTGRIETAPQPSKANKSFAGWYTDSECTEGNEVNFPYTVNSDITLYAKWIAEQCRITYYANGATGGSVPESVSVDKGSTYTVVGNTGNLTKNGYAFTKWNTKADGNGQGYSSGNTFTVTGDVSLYAMWGKDYAAMVTVEGGTFTQGNDNSSTSSDKPAHSVTLSSFSIGQYEVTYELWSEVKAWATSQETAWNVGSASKGVTTNDGFTDWEPATGISWYEAITWCNAYSEMKGLEPCYYSDSIYENVYRDCSNYGYVYWKKSANGYRLPTESEWEYAAKGGQNQKSYTYAGSNTINDVAWYSGNSKSETHPVGLKLPNSLGIYDMSGNVEEWCGTSDYSYSNDAQTNPNFWAYTSVNISGIGTRTVFYWPQARGGSYDESASFISSRCSSYSYPSYLGYGFRVARNAE